MVTAPEPEIRAVSQELMQELMGSVVAIDFVLCTLMDLPAQLLPGGDPAAAIRELLTESVCREVRVVGEDACRAATALIEKVVDGMARDAEAAAQMAEADGQRPC